MTDIAARDLRSDIVAFTAREEAVGLTSCDREPIHLSGAIQPHGMLLAVREADLVVVQVSANSRDHVSADPTTLIGAPLDDALGADLTRRLRVALDQPRGARASPMSVHRADGIAYELCWHRSADLVIVELEPVQITAATSDSGMFAEVGHAIEALQHASDVQGLCDTAAAEIKSATGYDRVMVYRFHADGHGEVIAERHEPDMEPFLGLHYPASDIPRQARKLFLLNPLRVIASVDDEPATLLSAPGADPTPLDLSLSELRSVSPIHLAYLSNMGVQASLTISLTAGSTLWGMIACHHRRPKRIGGQLRAACRVLGQMFSLHVAALADREQIAHRASLAQAERQLLARMAATSSLADAVASDELVLSLTAADGLVARIDGQTVSVGTTPDAEDLEAVLRIARADAPAGVYVSENLTSDLSRHGGAVRSPAAQSAIAGVVALPLTASYEDFLMWFRRETIQDVRWAGNPEKPYQGTARDVELTPRTSFAAWALEVRGRCRPWLAAEIDTGQGLAAAVPELLLARARDRLAHMAMHDDLTGLPNRTLLLDRCAHALARRDQGTGAVAVMFLDLDRFKLINDSLGHAAGDTLLNLAAQRIRAILRDEDTVARIGGDKFIVLCDSVSAQRSQELSSRIVAAFRRPFTIAGGEVIVTASVGVVIAQADSTATGLLRDADTAMYRAKHSGRDGATPFTDEMGTVGLRRVEIETGLRPALERRELRLDFQPIHDVSGVLLGFEALARWPLAGRGMVPVDEFITVAEASGLIQVLTSWVLVDGLAELALWRRRRPELGLTLAVNISSTQLNSPDLARDITAILDRHHLPAQALCLEITERALVADHGLGQAFLQQMRAAGVRLSIDDFGTGFSSLSYLTKLPVHELKIDRSFIAGLPARRGDAAVIAAIVELGHQLRMQVLAEGIETEDQLALVRRLGCDRVQGYLLGRPMAAHDVERFLLGYIARPPAPHGRFHTRPPASSSAAPRGPAAKAPRPR